MIPLWVVAFPPIQDLPNHLGRVHVILDLLKGGDAFAGEYRITWLPLPNLGADLLLLPLLLLFPAAIAGKVYISLVLLFTAWAGFRFFRAAGAPEMGWLALPLLLNWFVHEGFLAFLLSIPVVLLALAYRMERRDAWGWRERLVFGLFATAAWFAHLSAFGFLIAAVQIEKAWRGRWWHALRLEPGFLPGLLFWFWISSLETRGPGYVVYEQVWSKLWLFANLYVSWEAAGDVVLMTLAILAVAISACAVRREWLWPAAGAILLFLALPRAVLGGYFVDVRVLPFAAYLALAVFRAEPRRAMWLGAGVLALSSAWYGATYLRLGGEMTRMVRAANDLPERVRIFPLAEREEPGQVQTWHHAVTWLTSRRDAVTPYLFAKPFQHPLRAVHGRYAPEEYWFQEPGSPLDLDRVAKDWNYFWLTAPHPIEERLKSRADLVISVGALRIYRLR